MTRARLSSSFGMLLLSTTAIAASAAAQPADQAQGRAAAAPGGSSEEEIIVTAQRRAERLEDVPISVTTINEEQLDAANVDDLSDIQKLTPALRYDTQGPFTQATIRGIGSSIVVSGSTSNVGTYIDGFYSPNPQSADFQLLTVQNVQVLKGPQGTLFGRNATGGAILVTTEKPSQDPHGIVEFTASRFGTLRGQAYATAPITDNIAFDIGGIISAGDNYFTNILTDDDEVGAYKNWTVRTGLKIDLSDKVSVLLRYQHNRTKDPTNELAGIYVKDGVPQSIVPFLGGTIATRPGEVANTRDTLDTATNDIYQGTVTADVGFGTLTSYTQYRREEDSFLQSGIPGSLDLLYVRVPVLDKTFTQEFLLTSKPGPRLQWTLGAFYFNYGDRFDAFVSGLAVVPALPNFEVNAAGSYSKSIGRAAYADLTYQLADRLFVTAGARYSQDRVKDAYFYNTLTAGKQFQPTLKSNHVTPRFVLRYEPDDRSSVYASFTRGYKAAIYDLSSGIVNDEGFLDPIKPETINAFEVGYKRAAPGYSFDIAAYYYDYKQLQVATYGFIEGASIPLATILNAKAARIYGMEAQGRFNVTDRFEVYANAAYTNAKYKDFDNSAGFVPNSLETATIVADGLAMQRAPKFTGTLGGRYEVDVARGKLALSGNFYYSSKFFFDSSEQIPQKSYYTLNLRAGWTDPSDHFTLAVYGENVTGKRYLVQAYYQAPSQVIAQYNPPATYGVQLRFKFP